MSDEQPRVTLAIASGETDVFDPSIEGVDPITRAGTRLPKKLEKAVRARAREYGISLHKVRA
jgi:hypothetical protein